MPSLADVVNKYSRYPEYEKMRGVTTKISEEAHIKLVAIAAHFEVKKTPLAGEILEGAINDIFDQISGDFDEDVTTLYDHEMAELAERG